MANSSENQSYEEQWQKAFESAEMPPSPNVWKNIDQQLAAQEGGKYKRGFFFYRAAAAILLLCIAGLSWYTLTRFDTSSTIAEQPEATIEQPNQPMVDRRNSQIARVPDKGDATGEQSEVTIADGDAQTQKANLPNQASIAGNTATNSNQSSSAPLRSDGNIPSETEQGAIASNDVVITNEENEAVSANSTIAELTTAKTLIFPNEEVSSEEEVLLSNHQVGRLSALPLGGLALHAPTWVDNVDQLYLVPQYREEFPRESEKQGVQFFAGLAMAPSFFDPNFQSQSSGGPSSDFVPNGESFSPPGFDIQADNLIISRFSNSNLGSSPVVEIEEGLENNSSLSFSYGFNFGLELGERWSIESGLDFQNFQTTTETRYTVVNLQSGERYPLVATNAEVNAANYYNTNSTGNPSEVANQFQFISVPLLIGYNVRFSKVTLQVSPGIAANLFLGNRISSDQYASSTISRDGNSPFNNQYFSGMISGGVFYQLVQNYSLSLTPSYQFALSNLANDQATFSSQPQSFGLRLGFRYTFN
ncbi:outer membrane beta-barrel protein [Tunicatimonas pelagia]|uniref:outer membrane beta-barrel protein n=1 Tax=Tunicatimonas pelagia TaxID=931531 RepID=UPI002665C088|nr:outer membrane beta-barrel protein [Tunicatimonas pelagia]WKN43738.1 outer membrane beta-barrel protein [Tunicatimonas pelagia]